MSELAPALAAPRVREGACPVKRIPTLAVISGGDVASVYVRQLLRAVVAGRLATERIRVVDRDPGCAAAAHASPLVTIEVAEWSELYLLHARGGCSPRASVVMFVPRRET